MGQAKAWLPFASELMLPRVVRLLGEVVAPVIVVAAPGQKLPALSEGVTIVRDDVEGRGPLQGLLAGLKAVQGQADAAYVSSCDVPFLQPNFVRRMIELLDDRPICVPEVGGFKHPLAAIYRVEVASTIEQFIAENRWRVMDLFDAVPTRVVGPSEFADVDAPLQSLRNLNTPAEYEAAQREWKGERGQ
jgi:molybdopterin-guanine dinucleotide biosynthesis protein A